MSALSSAIDRLAEGLVRDELNKTDTQIRDGLIQRFEFTYEISHKTLKRYLVRSSASPDQLATSAAVQEAFSESDLPWKVDIVDWATTSQTFREIINSAAARRSRQRRLFVITLKNPLPTFCIQEASSWLIWDIWMDKVSFEPTLAQKTCLFRGRVVMKYSQCRKMLAL